MAAVTTLRDETELTDALAERFTVLVEDTLRQRDTVLVCLTGGQTPRRLYERLGESSLPWRARIPWPRVELFWSDERHVPPNHADSNYGMADRALLHRVPIPASNLHRIRGEVADPHEAAREYVTHLPSAFDVLLLGLGADAHIASIFPASPLLASSGSADTRVAAVWAPHLEAWRLTLTPETLLDARRILVLVSGRAKALAVRAALEWPLQVTRFPAQLLRRAGDRVEWFLDSEAASALAHHP